MKVFKKVLLTGVAGFLAAAASVPAARADSVAIFQGTVNGALGGAGQSSALNAAGTALNTGAGNSFVTPVNSAGTWTPTTPGVYNFNATTNAIGPPNGFLGSGPGTASGFVFNGTFTVASPITTFTGTNPAVTGIQTEWVFGFSEGGATNISITHDDGIALFVGGVLQTPSNGQTAAQAAAPTNTLLTTYTNVPLGAITLGYVSSNGLPEVLNMTVTPVVPLPAAGWLFGAGLGGLGLLMRRRRNAAVAVQA